MPIKLEKIKERTEFKSLFYYYNSYLEIETLKRNKTMTLELSVIPQLQTREAPFVKACSLFSPSRVVNDRKCRGKKSQKEKIAQTMSSAKMPDAKNHRKELNDSKCLDVCSERH